MKSIMELLWTISSIPHVDEHTRNRASYLSGWFNGGRGLSFADLFGGAR
jgi:hypothetical protein